MTKTNRQDIGGYMKGHLAPLPGRGVSLFVRIEGKGQPVLLMHGGPGADHTTLLPLLPLADRCKLIYYDHRCNGRSVGADITTMTTENLTADAEALREVLGIDKWAVLGDSFGGMVALEYAIRYPQHLSRLCILDSGGDAVLVQHNAPKVLGQRGYSRLFVETAFRFFNGQIKRTELLWTMMILGRAYYSHPGLLLLLREAWHGLRIRRNPDTCIYWFKNLLPGWSVMAQLKLITAPTLFVAGEDDFQFPPEHQHMMAASVPDARVEIIKGAGHNAHMEKPGEVISLVKQFIVS